MATGAESKSAPAGWGAPFDKLDKAWTKLEQYLAVGVILGEIVTLCLWVSIKGLATSYEEGGNVIGWIFRSIFTAVVLGMIGHLATRKQKPAVNRLVVTGLVIAGLFLGKVWVNGGSRWASNVVEWLGNASAVMLVGGPRGLVTRLTLTVALLGASMAASKGKHINIDIAVRYIPPRFAKGVAILGWLAAAAVCLTASFGFLDSICVTKFRADAFQPCGDQICDTPMKDRLIIAEEGVRGDLFLLGRQISLDLKTIPHVIKGDPYDKYLTAAEWNRWLGEAKWTDHFPEQAVHGLRLPEDDPSARKMPAVVAPDTGESRDLLIRDLNFVLPFGLLVIGIKFLLRILRALSGHVRVDPDAAHDEEDLKHAHDHDREVEEIVEHDHPGATGPHGPHEEPT